MEERLDDAINVLRNHAESMIGPQAGAGAPGQGPGPSPSLSHSNGIMAAYTPVLEPHMVKTRNKNKAKQLFTLNWNWNFQSFFLLPLLPKRRMLTLKLQELVAPAYR
jgi:hypothetical protein